MIICDSDDGGDVYSGSNDDYDAIYNNTDKKDEKI
jgi:hypothetical protein